MNHKLKEISIFQKHSRILNFLFLLCTCASVNFLMKAGNLDISYLIYSTVFDLFFSVLMITIAGFFRKSNLFLFLIILFICVYGFVQALYGQIFEAPLRFNQISIIKEVAGVIDRHKQSQSRQTPLYPSAFCLFVSLDDRLLPELQKLRKNKEHHDLYPVSLPLDPSVYLLF